MADPTNLDDLKEKGLLRDPFPAPDRYFDTLSERIQQRIAEEDGTSHQPAKVVPLRSRWYYAAAAVAVVLVSVWLIRPFPSPTEQAATGSEDEVQHALADISNEALIDYLQMNDVDIYTTVSLTDTEQEELLNAELESYELPEEYYPASEYIEDYL